MSGSRSTERAHLNTYRVVGITPIYNYLLFALGIYDDHPVTALDRLSTYILKAGAPWHMALNIVRVVIVRDSFTRTV